MEDKGIKKSEELQNELTDKEMGQIAGGVDVDMSNYISAGTTKYFTVSCNPSPSEKTQKYLKVDKN